MAKRVVQSNTDVSEVKSLLSKISARIEAFLYESMIRVEIGVDAILSRLPTYEEKEFEKELMKWNTIAQIITSTLGARRVHEAAYDAQPMDAGCMPGTRVSVLSKFVSWVKEDSKGIFWLAGMAGTGKTSVAVTLCRMLAADPDVLLGGAFFCSRTANVEGRTDARRILPTLAVMLANQSPQFAAKLAEELKPDAGAAAHRPVGDQIGPLLQQPLAALLPSSLPVVFVIDALDECSNERELAELLAAIAKFNSNVNVKFILSSRPETHILGSPISDRTQNDILQLHMISTAEVTEDIRRYIDDAFSKQPLARPWYSDTDVFRLATLADGLFIFASTMVSYVLNVRSVNGRATRLQTALSAVQDSKVALGSLNAMYELVLTRASDSSELEPEELDAALQVLASILTARMPLSVSALADLLGREADELRESLRRLHAVVHVPEEDVQPGLRTLHASFGDYLFSNSAGNIRIPASLGHDVLARGCLQRMAWPDLCFNVSQSRSSYQPNDKDVPHLLALSLIYACQHWAHHIDAASKRSSYDLDIVQIFWPNFLFWLEVLSILRRVGAASGLLRIARSAVKREEASQFLRDANTFVASLHDAIELSAPHIYLSALPFAAKDSLVYTTFSPLYSGLIHVDKFGADRHGSRLVMTLTGHEDSVTSVAYFSDGQVIVSGSLDGTVRFWDTRTGEETMTPLRSADGAIQVVSLAADGRHVAAGTSTGVVNVWNLPATHATLRRLCGHTDAIQSIALSQDGSLLASASSDWTLRLWSVETCQTISRLEGQTRCVKGIAFTSDGKAWVSCSDDGKVCLWDSTTGDLIGQHVPNQYDLVCAVSFSKDSNKFALGYDNGLIRIWELQPWRIIAKLQGHGGSIRSVHFSPDGRFLASTSDDMSLRLWNLQRNMGNRSLVLLSDHSSLIRSICFSPDGSFIASASDDYFIRIWDTSSRQSSIQPLPAHDDIVNSVAVSPDGVLIVSGSNDCTVRLWDLQTGAPKHSSLLGHTAQVNSIAVSSDSRLIASASSDHTIRLWNALTGEAVREPLQGHKRKVTAVAFSPDTRRLASGSHDKSVFIWDVMTGQLLTVSPSPDRWITTVSFAPDGRLLIAGDTGGGVHFWHAETGLRARESLSTGMFSVESIAFSTAGTHLLYGSTNGGVTICDIREGMIGRMALESNKSPTLCVGYSPDGRFLACGSEDRTVRLWDAATNRHIGILRGHGAGVSSVAFTFDGQSVISCSRDKTIRVWNTDAAGLSNSVEGDELAAVLVSATSKDGWLVGPADELLLWVPAEYRQYLQVPPYTTIIGAHRIVVTAVDDRVHRGENWTSCWRQNTSSRVSSTL